jgi:hypothetical protein
MEIRKFPLSPDISPLKGFAIFSRSSQSILELIRALERGDDTGHDELCFKLQFIRDHDDSYPAVCFSPGYFASSALFCDFLAFFSVNSGAD